MRLLAIPFAAVLLAASAARAEQAPPPPDPVPLEDRVKITELIAELGSEDWDSRAEAEKKLVEIGKPAIEPLKHEMETAKDPEVKVAAKRILQKLGALPAAEMTDEQFEEMLELLRSQDGVSWYGHGKPYFYLYQLNEKPEWNEALKGKVLAPRLAKALDDESGNLKRNAAYLLGEMGATEQATAVAKLLKDEEAMTRAVAAYSLGKMGNPEVADVVVLALSDNEAKVKCAAAIALENLPSAAAIEPLLGAMASDDAELRFQAYFSLRSLTGQAFRFNAYKGADERKASLKAIEDWWAKNKAGFTPKAPVNREKMGER